MRRDRKKPPPPPARRPEGPADRAEGLLLRLETRGTGMARAAEELDRLQKRLRETGRWEPVEERLLALCAAWSETQLRGDQAHAWLTLVGTLDLKEHAARVSALGTEAGLPAVLRIHACRTLARLGGEVAGRALREVLGSSAEPPVRQAAAEALGDLGDRSLRPFLQAMLEEDLPRGLWMAVSAAADRLR